MNYQSVEVFLIAFLTFTSASKHSCCRFNPTDWWWRHSQPVTFQKILSFHSENSSLIKTFVPVRNFGSLHFVFLISVTEQFYSGGSGTSGVLRWDIPVWYYSRPSEMTWIFSLLLLVNSGQSWKVFLTSFWRFIWSRYLVDLEMEKISWDAGEFCELWGLAWIQQAQVCNPSQIPSYVHHPHISTSSPNEPPRVGKNAVKIDP